MTSGPKSSNREHRANAYSNIESLAGVFHPHAIEVQDFANYELIIDVRPRADFEADHIPGAVQMTPVDPPLPLTTRSDDLASSVVVASEGGSSDIPPALEALVSPIKLDQAILMYCGRGGLDSLPLAKALRWRGWTVDVIPGGWINYHRWVQAGLEILPRLIAFRVVSASLGSEAARVLGALRAAGHQVLDLERLAAHRPGSLTPAATVQPSQAWFQSQLLQALRDLDPRMPVWVADADRSVGSMMLPGALVDALAIAPSAVLEVPLTERLVRWREDEPLLRAPPNEIVDTVAALSAPLEILVERWRNLAASGDPDFLACLLVEHFDALYAERRASHRAAHNALPPLVTDSLEPGQLADAVKAWMPVQLPWDAD
ncbi:tRNA 2-selenouridine synthase [Burkholderiaceae bacterium]|nr:tRNA 2-selenouridine synthase [Burkholderiaceae bacterium]